MSNTLLLTKVFLKESLDTRKFKENKKKTLSFGAFVGLMGLLFVGLATIYALTYANMFIQAGVDLIYLFCMFSSISSLLILMTSITRAKGLFISKDYDLLRSMPISKNEIVTSKLITMYLVELVYAAIIMIPCAIVCSIITGNYSLLALAIPVTLVIPGLPIVIGALAGLLVALFADRSKFGNIISILSYGILIVAIMIFSSTFGQSVGSGMAEGEVPEVFLSMATLNPTLKFVLLGQTENALWHIAFFACNILALIAAITIIASLFDKVYAIVSSSVQTTKYKATTLKTESQFKTLFKNEIKRYFSSKLYCINTLMSGLCSIFMCIMIAITMGELFADPDIAPYITKYGFLFAGLILFGVGLSTPASVSISMEGNTFWMTKFMPIDYKALTKAKLTLSILVLSVCSIVASTVLVFLIKPSVLSIVSLYITPLFYIVGVSSLGLLINTAYYKLTWKNEVEVVKNSSSVIISMLIDMGITIVFVGIGVLSVVLSEMFESNVIGILLFTGANIFFGVIMLLLSYNICPNRIKKIEA